MAWYKEWFGQEYLDLYSHRDTEEAQAHVEFVLQVLGQRPELVLDLACGGGRHTLALRKRGIRALGIDLSLRLLTQEPSLPAAAGDMRILPFANGSFEWVLNFFTSFGYFENERENFQVLEEIVRVLSPGGRLLIDFFNLDRVLRNLRANEVINRGGRRTRITRWYDSQAQRINKRIRVEESGGCRTFLESVRAYRKDEVINGLQWAGLEVTGAFGNFQRDPYQSDSERLILIGHKPA